MCCVLTVQYSTVQYSTVQYRYTLTVECARVQDVVRGRRDHLGVHNTGNIVLKLSHQVHTETILVSHWLL